MRITLPSSTPAELALPDGTPDRGLVLFPDIFGLRPLFDDWCSRLAAEHRWAVCAVEPFPDQQLPTVEDRFDAVRNLTDHRVLGDAIAAADLLTSQHGCQRVAALGFCIGGMYAIKAAASGRFDRTIAFYGMIRVPVSWRGPNQGEPLAVLAEYGARCPLLAVVGDLDPYTPPEDVDALRAVGPAVTIVRYAHADHGFVHDPERPAHRPEDAADALARAVSFLK